MDLWDVHANGSGLPPLWVDLWSSISTFGVAMRSWNAGLRVLSCLAAKRLDEMVRRLYVHGSFAFAHRSHGSWDPVPLEGHFNFM